MLADEKRKLAKLPFDENQNLSNPSSPCPVFVYYLCGDVRMAVGLPMFWLVVGFYIVCRMKHKMEALEGARGGNRGRPRVPFSSADQR